MRSTTHRGTRWQSAVLLLGVGLLAIPLLGGVTPQDAAAPQEQAAPAKAQQEDPEREFYDRPRPTADHSKFEVLKGPFPDGPSVTKACLKCHTEAAKQIMKTRHWTWYDMVETNFLRETGKKVGKGGDVINNFCIAVSSNEPRCTSCHVGYGWKDKSFDFSDETRVDCLACHDQTLEYKKFPTDAGHPVYEPKEWPKGSGKYWQPPDLAKIAQNVGAPKRENCGACHFFGGGGEGVKHGDMDETLANPHKDLDVHLSPEGGNFGCSQCHVAREHNIMGPNSTLPARDRHGFLRRGEAASALLSCEACHTSEPHHMAADNAKMRKLDDHSDKVACQSCHIPRMAREKPTKMWWDWSKAGDKSRGKDGVEKSDVKGSKVNSYDVKKGEFIWIKDEKPEYFFYNGQMDQVFVGTKVDDKTPGKETTRKNPYGFDKLDLEKPVVPINPVYGAYDDPKARIHPFKVHRGIQAYDPETKELLVPKLFGKKGTGSYWTEYDWKLAFDKGMGSIDQPWSGKYEWIQSEMFWPLTHMVAPAKDAVGCIECHTPEKNGRLAQLNGFYMPGRDRSSFFDTLGLAIVLLSILGAVIHGVARMVAKPKA